MMPPSVTDGPVIQLTETAAEHAAACAFGRSVDMQPGLARSGTVNQFGIPAGRPR
jgi:hypothetical protein